MKKEKITRNKSLLAIGGIIIAVIMLLTGCGKKEENLKNENGAFENQTQYTEAQNVTTEKNNEKKESNTSKNNTTSSNKNNSTSTNNKSTTPKKLNVSREGSTEEVASKEYSSSLGYTMRYATENFKVSNHDNGDWYVGNPDNNCVVVEKENVSYSKKIASISNYKKTEVNGYEAVYTTKNVEGQFETTYYVNAGKDSTYVIVTSCQGTTEYLEGLEKIMDAMVQTFAVK